MKDRQLRLRIGWAQTDITPEEPVMISGQFHVRISEGVADPITATALVLDTGQDHAVMVSLDVVTISADMLQLVRERVSGVKGLDPEKVILNATHTHTGPEVRIARPGTANVSTRPGVELDAMPVEVYLEIAAERIAAAVKEAWEGRTAGRMAYGLGYAVVGRNRRWSNAEGEALMYGNTNDPGFSHIEGYEDHSLNLLATYSERGDLTGLVVNVPCPSQVSESEYQLSADYWYETRTELRRRFGEGIFILPQCSAAGDQSPHLLFDKQANNRMLSLKGRSVREEIAQRIAQAVEEVLATVKDTADGETVLQHQIETLELPMNELTEEDARSALAESDSYRRDYEEEIRKLEENPGLRDESRWYVSVTRAHRRMLWHRGVAHRFEAQKKKASLPVEVHVVRLGGIAFATNRFEFYLDMGIHIKARSPACQTFIVQLAGEGTYCPSTRSVAGGGYGSVAASNPVGPEGGRMLASRTVELLQELWEEN